MIIEFTCKNFKSFKDKKTFTMEAENRLQSANNGSVFQEDKSPKLLTSSGLFGLNAGGKTNILEALKATAGVINNTEKTDLAFQPFLLDHDSSKSPTE